jgi:hypothetical protein
MPGAISGPPSRPDSHIGKGRLQCPPAEVREDEPVQFLPDGRAFVTFRGLRWLSVVGQYRPEWGCQAGAAASCPRPCSYGLGMM